jgi:hypothetical protein
MPHNANADSTILSTLFRDAFKARRQSPCYVSGVGTAKCPLEHPEKAYAPHSLMKTAKSVYVLPQNVNDKTHIILR